MARYQRRLAQQPEPQILYSEVLPAGRQRFVLQRGDQILSE